MGAGENGLRSEGKASGRKDFHSQLAELKDTWASERSSIQTLDLHLSVASAIRSQTENGG